MKRFYSLLLIAALLLSGCADSGSTGEEAFNDTVVENEQENKTPTQTIEKDKEAVQKPSSAPQPDNNQQQSNQQTSSPENPSSSDQKEEPNQENVQQKDSKQEEPAAYLNIACASIKDWQMVEFENAATSKLKFPLPADWKITKENSTTYNLEQNGAVIGTLSTKVPETADNEYEYDYYNDTEAAILAFTQINQYGDQFYRIFKLVNELDAETFELHLKLHYSAMDKEAVTHLLENAVSIPVNMTTTFPSMKTNNSSKQILILGNSFINTSKIGATLQDMLTAGKTGYTVKAISRGMAEVEDYANDTSICNDIRSGKYCYVFQCGFYGGEENIVAFETIVDACKASNTKLVIFPAHNESASIITSAKSAYSGPIFLDWKGEITQLIDSGISKWAFCIDDSYKHSTPLAGYVGAHMIYRNLFRQIPPTLTQNAGVSMDEVRNILGDYTKKTADPQVTSYSIK